MEITIKGATEMLPWTTIQWIIREASGKSGRLTRIARSDNKSNYGTFGEYHATFRPESGDETHVVILVQS